MEKEKLVKKVSEYSKKIKLVKNEIHKGIIGQEQVIDSVLKCLICNDHVLIEGVPGVAKTFLVMLLSRTIKGSVFQRIQFTPDLLPTDITGVTVYEEKRGFYTVKGPIFANMVVGDEINRTPPKVQSAMLQAMQEREVTIGRQTFPLPKPFFVMATQNPLETKGVYPLPEAQVDRFLFKINMPYPKKEDEIIIIDQNVEVKRMEDFDIKKIITLQEVLEVQSLVKKIYISDELKKYIVHLVDASRHPEKYKIREGKYIQWGASPRATIYLTLAAKATALMDNRIYVTPKDIRNVAKEVLRHRIILNYEGKA
ncbi:MAG: ATPase, partial [Candidatus Aenigmatarchaeota archaeon]